MAGIGNIQNTILYGLPKDACLSVIEMSGQFGIERKPLAMAAGKLLYRGYLERIKIGCYRLTDEGKKARKQKVEIKSGPFKPLTGAPKPRKNTLRQRVWNAMRMSNSFSINDLMLACEADAKSRNNIHKFCNGLKRANYLLELPVRARGVKLTSNGFKRYRLLENTGEIVPSLRMDNHTLYDHNLGKKIRW